MGDILNPYWDIVKDIPGDEIMMRFDNRWQPASYPPMSMFEALGRAEEREAYETWTKEKGRSTLVKKYSWAIPSPESIEWIVKVLDGRPVVEIGAGTGYWAWLLTQAGVDIRCYDHRPPGMGYNEWHSPRVMRVKKYTQEEHDAHREQWEKWDKIALDVADLPGAVPMPRPRFQPLPEAEEREVLHGVAGEQWVDIIDGDHTALRLPENRDRVLFLSWPPYDTSMGEDVLACYDGDLMIFIGESYGCTGTDAFHDTLEKEWLPIATGPMVQWSGMHDYMTLYVRATAPDNVKKAVLGLADAEV
jgi:hypothetical protein